jgi:hypothetical protein
MPRNPRLIKYTKIQAWANIGYNLKYTKIQAWANIGYNLKERLLKKWKESERDLRLNK